MRSMIFERSPMFALLLMMYLGSAVVGAAFAEEVEVFGTVESFTWKEFSDRDVRFLKESGVLLGVGIDYRKEFHDQIILDESAGIFGGNVSYDGTTQDGVPVKSMVDYLGLKFKADAGKNIGMVAPFTIEPFAGLGLSAWFRRINNSVTTIGLPKQVQGYTEQWTTLYARLGARAGRDISQAKRVFVEAGVRLPLYNENTAYFSREGIGPDVTMHPGRQVSLFGEGGVRIDRMKASVFYEGMRFSRSADVSVPGGFVYQPRSAADIYGINIGIMF